MANKTIKPFEAIAKTKTVAKGESDPDLKYIGEFLNRFGYLADGVGVEGELDNRLSEALVKYQRCHGIAETGDFDSDTRSQMSTHRCAMPDLAAGVAFAARCAWTHTNLTYAFETGTGDTGGEFDAMRRAFDTWADASPLNFTEVGQNQKPDIVVDWRPAADPDLSMVGGTLAHADFPPACGVVTNNLPKPIHFDDSEHQWVNGSVSNSFDIETVGLHEIGHIIGLQHSNVSGSVMWPSVSSNSTLRDLTTDEKGGVADLYGKKPPGPGIYKIRQKSAGRFLDAHETSNKDFSVVTRTSQSNDTQRWAMQPVGAVFTIRHKHNGRFLDAHENLANDFSAVTRDNQANDTQQWVVIPDPTDPGVCTIQQLKTGRYLDAWTTSDKDFSAVTRTAQNNDTQRWILGREANNTYTIRQKINNRFLDAWTTSGKDFSAVTRTAQNNDTQRWILGQVGVVYTIQQVSSGRFLDAWESSSKDFSAVTRTTQFNNTQKWVVIPSDEDSFVIRQLSSRRFLDAHNTSANDFSAVTRPAQNNDTQRWIIS